MPKPKVRAFFTGHEWCTYARRTNAMIDKAIELGCEEFVCSMMPGFDLEVAEILLYRNLPWIALLPYSGTGESYPRRDWTKYNRIFNRKKSLRAIDRGKLKILYPFSNSIDRSISRSLQINWMVKNCEVCLSVSNFDETDKFADRAADRAYHSNLLVVNFYPDKVDEFNYFVRYKQLELFA
ncbi:MAG: hypothetical protein MUE44_34720 [Oscillatoriaceae cyanobacterium Prado104]|jgi:hypothetical protein|nr:hypothetical protein [Oscillatoriaceae cyanobacterium Prado104]